MLKGINDNLRLVLLIVEQIDDAMSYDDVTTTIVIQTINKAIINIIYNNGIGLHLK